MKRRMNPRIGLLAVASVLVASFTWLHAQQRSNAPVAIVADDIGGVVWVPVHARTAPDLEADDDPETVSHVSTSRRGIRVPS